MLLIHGNKVIKELARRPQLPLGLAELHMDTDRSIYRTLPHSDDGLPAYTEQMAPGDRMHLYTDGVIEAAPPTAAGLALTCSATSSSATATRARPHRRCSAAHPDHHRISARPHLRRRHHRTDRVDAPLL
jgi:hypothetical protein